MKLFSKLKTTVDKDRLPRCVAFIIDGNGRWATERNMPRMYGHKAGIDAVIETIKNAQEIGLKELIFFCFSTENWNRPKQEVDGLFDLFREYLNNDTNEYSKKNIKFKMCGERKSLPQDIVKKAETLEDKTKDCDDMTVCLCINYGGRNDIVNAVNKCLKDGKKDITEEEFKHYLYTSELSDPDLIIRTSGEQRISNFLLYQMAYSELYFTKTYWPDFDKKELLKALHEFQQRNRRFGAIKE
ncbi:MAG: polyprenyl diphosphate synthase [Christensenellales bacterium]